MKEFIEKLICRLEEEKRLVPYNRLLDTIEDKPKEVGQLMTYQRVIEIVNQLAEEYNNDVCEWKQHEREIDVYFTECGQAHIFVDGNPEENNHVFCPYCGKKIKVAPYQPKGE